MKTYGKTPGTSELTIEPVAYFESGHTRQSSSPTSELPLDLRASVSQLLVPPPHRKHTPWLESEGGDACAHNGREGLLAKSSSRHGSQSAPRRRRGKEGSESGAL